MTDLARHFRVGIRSAVRRLIAALCLLTAAALPATAEVDIDSEKSLMFAGRCLAQVMNGAPVDIDRLKEMPEAPAQAHLFGEPGSVWYGTDDSVVMVVHKNTHCGVNVFEETAEDASAFLKHWLEQDGSPFALQEQVTLNDGNVRITYSGHCTECGFDVHAQAFWFQNEQFTIYRLYATKPEGA